MRTGEVIPADSPQRWFGGALATVSGAWLGAVLALGGLGACTSYVKGAEGERCTSEAPCKKGLRCSLKRKRCYRPVDCGRLAKRLEACAGDVLATWRPAFKKLPAAKRATLVKRVREHFKTEVAAPCRYDARAYRKKHNSAPPTKRSWGEDRDAKVINRCLRKASCAEFATCWLTHARLIGDKAPSQARLPVFPLAIPQARPVPSDPKDGKDGKDTPKAKDAMKAKDTMKAKGSMDDDKAKKARPAPRPRPR